MAECTYQRTMKWCNCTYEPCDKKGKCCECLRSHLKAGEFPACVFPNDVEKTFDRSIERFMKTYQQRGGWW